MHTGHLSHHHRRDLRQERRAMARAGRRGLGSRRHGLALRHPLRLLVGPLLLDPCC